MLTNKDVNNILDYEVKPNFALLSSKYKNQMKDIVSLIKNILLKLDM